MFLKLFIIGFVLVGLSSAQCSASLLKKHSRRVPVSETSVQWVFKVKSNNPNEVVGITGEDDLLGNWNLNKAILLNRTDIPTVWTGNVDIPLNTTLYYRYFTCMVDFSGTRQIKHWESHLNPRILSAQNSSGEVMEVFGLIDGVHQIHKGWLTNETIVQFKLFKNPLVFKNPIGNKKLLIKLIPLEYDPFNKQTHYTEIVSSTKVNAEFTRFEYGNSAIKPQGEYGVPYEQNDMVVFHITAIDPTKVAYLLKLYFYEPENPEFRHFLGYQHIDPQVLQGSEGSFNVDILSPTWMDIIGNLSVSYLVITPLPTPNLNFRTSFVHHWQKNWTSLDIGHRGLGKSLTMASNAAPIVENTVASMKQSVLEGTDMVEFDVQLTKDLIAIISHDFFVYICLEAKTPTSIDDLTKVLIKDLTYDQLKSLRTYQVVSGKVIEYPAHISEQRKDHRLFPTLEEFFDEIDPSVGFDIEIKWPQMTLTGPQSEQTIDKNLFVDVISDVILTKGCGRLSFLTSFDADICTMFRFKQNMYPVAFLAQKKHTFTDPRSKSIKDAVNNADAFDLLGVVPHTANVDANQVQIVRDLGKEIFVWGDDASSTKAIDYYKSIGVTAVIYDRIDLFIPESKSESVLKLEHLNDLFQLQCLNNTFGEPKEEEVYVRKEPSRSRFL